jgi:hypothetical protein
MILNVTIRNNKCRQCGVVLYTARYHTRRTACLEEMFSDHMGLRPIFVYILYTT